MKILRDKKSWDGKERRSIVRIKMQKMKNSLLKFQFSDLRKRLLIYFALIIFVTFSVGIQLIVEVGSDRMHKQISKSISGHLKENADIQSVELNIKQVLKRFQMRMVLIMIIVLICVIATMFVFIRNIVEPLDIMVKVTKKIAKGHLDQTIPIQNQDEIGQIGELINDLSANLQEILLHVWNHTGKDIELLNNISKELQFKKETICPDVNKNIAIVAQDIEDMQNMVKAFDFYNIKLDSGKVVADTKKEIYDA